MRRGPGGEEARDIGIRGPGDQYAVGGADDRPAEALELLALFLPGAAIVPREMLELLEDGVHVSGQHFAVGVDIDALALGLHQEVVQVQQVVAADQNARPGLNPLAHFGDFGLAKQVNVAVVEQLHGLQVHAPTFEDEFEQGFDIEVHVGHRGEERLLDERFDLGVRLAQSPGVVLVGGHALKAAEQNLLETLYILILSTHAGGDTPGPAIGLFALITKHV